MNVIVVAPSHVPFAIGGAEKLWWGLVNHINGNTQHQADLVKLPTPEDSFWEVVDSYRAFAALDLRPYEAIISTKYPAWMTDHPRHILYLQHPLRGLYDTYPPHLPARCESTHPEVAGIVALIREGERSRDALAELFARLDALRTAAGVEPEVLAFPGPLIREVVQFCDRVAMRPGAIHRYAAISATVAARPGYFPEHAAVTSVHHPSDLSSYPRPRRGRYLFTVSRLDPPKRLDLLIDAMRHVRADIELRIAGTGPDEARLRELAAGDPRVRFLGFVNDDEVLRQYAGALAVPFIPYEEDYGLVSLEAMSAGKSVITCVDSGGPAELVEDRVNGLIAAPEPSALAERIELLAGDRRLARRMGLRGRARAAEITWDRVIEALLAS